MPRALGIGIGMPFGGGVAFSPLALFAASEVGVWYDPSDFSTMWKDTAGTDPVTAVDDVVARIDDKSGNGKHATQGTLASRPILKEAGGKYFLLFDGSDDSMATAAIDFSATDEMSVFAGVRKLSDAAFAAVAELSASSAANNGAFGLFGPHNTLSATYFWRSRGTASAEITSAGSYASPITNVLTGLADISADNCILRANGAEIGSAATDQGTGNYGNHILYIGSRAGTGVRYNGRLYSLIVRGKTSTADEIALAEAWVNSKTGAY
jgi:hypothetical protein